jgi:RsiW-degrading membrane proteinase PrsW (M82 family)
LLAALSLTWAPVSERPRDEGIVSGTRQRFRAGAIGCLLGGISLAAIAAVVLLVVASVPDRVGLALSIAAACIPALFYAGVVLRLDRYEIEPMRVIAACFIWGAVGAILLSVIGSILFQGVMERSLGGETAAITAVVIGAPLIEETFKGIALLAVLVVARGEIDSTLDGLVYGALIGVGFAMTENMLYFGQTYLESGIGEFGILVLARAVLGGLGHPSYTAVTGAAVGWSRGRYGQGIARVIVPILGWAIAVALHVAWNGGLILASALLGEGVGLLEIVAIQSLLVIVPAVLVLYAIARLSARHELEILRDELRDEVQQGTITQAEYLTIVDDARRQRALAAARDHGGRSLRGRQLAFFHTAAELAFRHHHRRRGEAARPAYAERDERDRQRLAVLRHELTAAGLPPLEA